MILGMLMSPGTIARCSCLTWINWLNLGSFWSSTIHSLHAHQAEEPCWQEGKQHLGHFSRSAVSTILWLFFFLSSWSHTFPPAGQNVNKSSNLRSRYPVNIDLHPGVIFPQVPFGLPTQYPTLADQLHNAGYVTHAVGKWHLGFCNKKYLPTSRGFDHHYGFWLGAQGYYSHIRDHGFDLRSDLNIVHADNRTFSTELFGYQAANIMSSHRI